VSCPLVLPEALTDLDQALLDKGLYLWRTLLTNHAEVSVATLLTTAYELDRPVTEIEVCLESYGLRVPAFAGRHSLDREGLWDDIRLLTEHLSGPDLNRDHRFPPRPTSWLDPAEAVPLEHLCAASAKLGIPLPEVVARLRGLGVDVPDAAHTIRAAMAKLPRLPREQNPA
jgi:hypothetical protein